MASKLKLLVIDENHEELALLVEYLEAFGHKCETADSLSSAQSILEIKPNFFDIIFSEYRLTKMTGLQFLEFLHREEYPVPRWVFVSRLFSSETIERGCALGALDYLEKPFTEHNVKILMEKMSERERNPLREIMDVVQGISGVQLGADKKLLVETRLIPRSRALGFRSLDQYLSYFQKHRSSEIKEVISLMTTHTTDFFRESDHYDYLMENVFPRFRGRKSPVRIWSAASSTGQELFSLAIAWNEFVKNQPGDYPKVEFVGTDIDSSSVAKANEGIYRIDNLKDVDDYLLKEYFDIGTDEFSGLARVKDEIHGQCRFSQCNLLGENYPFKNCDIIFLRNVLIYFNSKDVDRIAHKMCESLAPNGLLFVGHSESLAQSGKILKTVGNSIYSSIGSSEYNEPTEKIVKEARKIRVMVVDDSSTIRQILKQVLTSQHGFEIIAEAENPIMANDLLKTVSPDVMLLDIHMPKMTGIEFLEKYGSSLSFPVVMLSSVNYEDAVSVLRCFEMGAVEYMEKPELHALNEEGDRIRAVLANAVAYKKKSKRKYQSNKSKNEDLKYRVGENRDLILLGSSTGGIEALTHIFSDLPQEIPPILVVQHIPPNFSKAFANRLNDMLNYRVKEAEDGEFLENNTIYIAPGGLQMGVKGVGLGVQIKIVDDGPVNRHKPSVDYLFNSVIQQHIYKNHRIVAAILTGMGADGAKGLKALHDLKIPTIAQNEETCVVFGMPNAAIQLNAVDEILPLPSIPYHLFRRFERSSNRVA